MSRKLYRLQVGPADAGLRLDQFVPAHAEELSRSYLRKIVDLGGVHVAGRRVRKCSHPVQAGETVEIHLDGLPLDIFTLSGNDILYQDQYILVVNKPAGVETQPTPARYKGTLYEALLRYRHNPFRPLDRPELGMMQRLDRETSGIMVFSVHPRAHKALTHAFSERKVEKCYLALVTGRFAESQGEIRSLLARVRSSNRMKSVARGGKEAVTRYRVVEEFAGATLVELDLLTGRSHQIRVHCAEAGHPLFGDRLYGGPRNWHGLAISRQMLHSWRLSLNHPVTGVPLTFEASPCPDMEGVLRVLRSETHEGS